MRRKVERLVRTAAIAAAAFLAGGIAWAETNQGDSILDLGLGLGLPVSGLDLSRFGGGSESSGGAGVSFSPQYLYAVRPEWGIGAELTYMDFPSSSVSVPGGAAAASGDLLTLEAIARYLFYPQAGFSPYMLGGVGLARYAATVSQGGDTLLNASSTGLALSAGAGLQADLGTKMVGMAELRWQFGTDDQSQFGTSLYNAVGFLLRLGWRY